MLAFIARAIRAITNRSHLYSTGGKGPRCDLAQPDMLVFWIFLC